MECSTNECDQKAEWWITAPTGVTRLACVDCQHELVAAHGFKLDREIGPKDGKWDKNPEAQAD